MRFAGVFVCLFVAGATGTALGADMAPPAPAMASPPVYNWTGIYFGGNGGYGWATSSGTATTTGGLIGGLSVATSGSVQGPVAGGQVGANWQTGPWVLGAEGDFDWSGQSKNLTLACGAGCALNETGAVDWFATARVRVGYAFDRLLVYGTGGAAWMKASDNLNATVGGTTLNLISLSNTPIGFAAGGGVEFAVTSNISARAEYLFLQAASYSATAPIAIAGGTIPETGTIRDNLVRAGINVRLPIKGSE